MGVLPARSPRARMRQADRPALSAAGRVGVDAGQSLFKRFQAKTSTTEMYATVDQLVDRLDKQIRKHKERRIAHKGRKKTQLPATVGASPDLNDLKIVRPKIAVLSRKEARDRLDADPGAMLLFTCVDSGKLQILRRSETGHVVLIDP